MSRFNSVPIIVQQMVESVQDKTTPSNVKFNQIQMIETIRDYCEQALTEWRKEQQKLQFKKRR